MQQSTCSKFFEDHPKTLTNVIDDESCGNGNKTSLAKKPGVADRLKQRGVEGRRRRGRTKGKRKKRAVAQSVKKKMMRISFFRCEWVGMKN